MAVLRTEDRPASRNTSRTRAARLVVPSGLLVDDVTRDRLARQLARAPESVAGVAAECAPLPPGSSYRVHAEWKSLEPLDAARVAPSNTIKGAVLLREGVTWSIHGECVELHADALLVDPGAHVHDPRAADMTVEPADASGRSPFPRRPIVVFLASAPDAELTDWARRLVNRLIARDVEGRLLLPSVGEGVQLTRPAAPSEASVRALAPDVIVALDRTAETRAHQWCSDNRSTVIIGFDRSLATPIELVSWQIGRASGRLRARIGPLVDAPGLAALVRRLCAGPQPIAPRDRPARTESPVFLKRAERDTRSRTCAIVTGEIDALARRRIDAISDHMQAAGMAVAMFPISEGVPESAADAALLLLAGRGLSDRLQPVVAARREKHLPSVLDLQPGDLVVGNDGSGEIADDTANLARACERVTSFGGTLHRVATALGVRALAVPTMLTRRHVAELRAARSCFDPGQLVMGWRLGTIHDAGTPYRDAVALGLAKLVADVPDLGMRALCEDADVPAAIQSQVDATGRDKPTATDLGAWFVQVFTPTLLDDETADDVLPFTEASQAGVPTIMPSAARGAIDGFVSPALLVDDPHNPEHWSTAFQYVFESVARRNQMSVDVRQRADSVNAPTTSKLMMNRLLGWARFEETA